MGLWRAASSGAASGTSFGEQISGTALGSSFVNSFLGQRWGAAMRGPAFDDAFWEQLSGRNFGKPLWELCGEHLVVCEELRVPYWYCRLCTFMLFLSGTCACVLVGKVGISFLLNLLAPRKQTLYFTMDCIIMMYFEFDIYIFLIFLFLRLRLLARPGLTS